MAHHGQIVGDEQVGHAEARLKLLQHVDDLRLNGNVQRGDRLVADDEVRLAGQGAGDADALALTAGELVGIAVQVILLQAHALHQLAHAVVDVLCVHALVAQRLADDAGHGHAGVQRRVGILEDHLHAAAVGQHLLFIKGCDVRAVQQNLARRGLVQAHDGAADGGLSAAGLAHQAEGLARIEVEADVVHGLERLFLLKEGAAHREIHLQIAD